MENRIFLLPRDCEKNGNSGGKVKREAFFRFPTSILIDFEKLKGQKKFKKIPSPPLLCTIGEGVQK